MYASIAYNGHLPIGCLEEVPKRCLFIGIEAGIPIEYIKSRPRV